VQDAHSVISAPGRGGGRLESPCTTLPSTHAWAPGGNADADRLGHLPSKPPAPATSPRSAAPTLSLPMPPHALLQPPTFSTRALASGSCAMPMYTSLSMRPGRRREGSSRSGRLVAPAVASSAGRGGGVAACARMGEDGWRGGNPTLLPWQAAQAGEGRCMGGLYCREGVPGRQGRGREGCGSGA